MRSTVSSQRSRAANTASRGLVVLGQHISAVHRLRNGNSRRGESQCRQVDVLDQIVAHSALGNARPANDERHVRSFVVEKLLAAGVADAVIGHEDHERVFENAFLLQPREHLPDVLVGEADGIEIRGPVAKQHRVARIVRRQRHVLRLHGSAEFLLRALEKAFARCHRHRRAICRRPAAPA